MSSSLRGSLNRHGRLPRHLLSGLLVCDECGGTFRCLNGREYGCASHKDGGPSACANGLRVRVDLAERKLLSGLASEMLSAEAIALLERRVREHLQRAAETPKERAKLAPDAARKVAEIEQLRAMMKAGSLSQSVAQAAIEKAEEQLRAIEQAAPTRPERQVARVLHLLSRAAETLRARITGGNLGVREPGSIIHGRNTLFRMFGGKVRMRRAPTKDRERPYLIARLSPDADVLLEAATYAAGCVPFLMEG